MSLGISDEEVDQLPFHPVIIVANLDDQPGPNFDVTSEGPPYEVLAVDLTVANADTSIFPSEIPIGQVWVDSLSVGAVCQIRIGQGRTLLTLNSAGASYDFEDTPTRGGIWLTNAIQPANSTLRLGVAMGKNLRARLIG
jgi:hypothetical protein